jgi:CBS domain containing-hemolysin-like protein
MLPSLGALALFLIGLRLTAFFSGIETGFYRASRLRLSIDAQGGDPLAKRILWFSNNASYFVVTTLVGNNFANYFLTAAVGLAATEAGVHEGMAGEIVSTLLIAPLVFTFGEMIPKNLYYRAPLQLLRRNARWFFFFYRIFLPISFPVIGITWLLERVSRTHAERPGQFLGRTRLFQVLSEGHNEGLLTDVQSRLIEGLMHIAGQPVLQSMVPTNRVLGVPDNFERDAVIDFAHRYGVNNVAIRQPSMADSWYGYVRVADVAITREPLAALIRRMPVIDSAATKLEALLALRVAGVAYGVVKSGERVMGLASEHGLSEQLFRVHDSGLRTPVGASGTA